MRPRQLVAYLSMALIWGVSFLLLLKVVRAFGWVGAITFRALIASATLLAIAVITRRRLVFGHWRPLALVGVTTVAGQLLGMSIATPLIGTAMTAIVIGTIPLLSMVIGQVWGLERVTRPARLGLLLGFAGIVLLVGFPAVPFSGAFLGGCAVALFGAACGALGSNVASRYLRTIGSWEQTIGAVFFGGALMLPMLFVVPVPDPPAPVDFVYLASLALLCSSLAYVLYFRLVAEAGATVAISVEFVVTVIAVGIGAVALGEHLSVVQLVGGVVIIAGCALVVGLVPRRRLSGP